MQYGDPAEQIFAAANQSGADLLVEEQQESDTVGANFDFVLGRAEACHLDAKSAICWKHLSEWGMADQGA